MPLIKPEVQKILREAGLTKDSGGDYSEDLTLEGHLTEAGLSSNAIAENLSNIALHSGNDNLRLRALETALKIKGALKEQVTELPNFTIVIQNTSPNSQDLSKTGGVNPILFPRQSLNLNTNASQQEPSDSKGPLKN
jgi:hypothetical protein